MSQEKIKGIIDKILTWLRDVLPTATAVGSWVYNYMLRRLNKAEKEHEKTKLEKEYLENKIEVEKELGNKSDRDIIMDAANEGSRSSD